MRPFMTSAQLAPCTRGQSKRHSYGRNDVQWTYSCNQDGRCAALEKRNNSAREAVILSRNIVRGKKKSQASAPSVGAHCPSYRLWLSAEDHLGTLKSIEN
ncbi:hypothetical protein CCMA1212_001894 [Trichoderma ghanense]|uniref:SSCRP protein n=1 Tax=Trichoderma ghanense TaxID=65468 RepID=A0ABY2HCN9_9HYPO